MLWRRAAARSVIGATVLIALLIIAVCLWRNSEAVWEARARAATAKGNIDALTHIAVNAPSYKVRLIAIQGLHQISCSPKQKIEALGMILDKLFSQTNHEWKDDVVASSVCSEIAGIKDIESVRLLRRVLLHLCLSNAVEQTFPLTTITIMESLCKLIDAPVLQEVCTVSDSDHKEKRKKLSTAIRWLDTHFEQLHFEHASGKFRIGKNDR